MTMASTRTRLIMEHIPLHEAVESLEKGKGSMQLLKSFFSARLELEADIEGMWTVFANKWEKKLMDLEEDPLFQSSNGGKSLAEILHLLTIEREKNTIVCCSVKSLLQRKRNSPTAILEKWISDHDDSSTEEYNVAYMSALETLSESEKKVTNSKRALNEKVERLEEIDKNDPTQSLMQSLMTEEVSVAFKSHRQLVDDCTREYAQFNETMKDLQDFLRGYQQGRIDVIKESVEKYVKVIGEYDEQRMSRKQRLSQVEENLAKFSTDMAIDDWLSKLHDPIMLPDYEMDFLEPPFQFQKPKQYSALKKFRIPNELYTIIEEKEKEEAAEQHWAEYMYMEETEEEEEEETEEEETEEESEEEEAEEEGEEKEEEAASVVGDTSKDSITSTAYAVQNYQILLPEHLPLRSGQKVYQISTSSNGLRFGYIIKRKWPWSKKEKRYGYYPGKIVIANPTPVKKYHRLMCCFSQ